MSTLLMLVKTLPRLSQRYSYTCGDQYIQLCDIVQYVVAEYKE